MTTVSATPELPAPGTVCLLTTHGPTTLHTRPVTVWPGACAGDLFVLTEPDAEKISDIAGRADVALGGPSPDGWWSAEGSAVVDRDATATALRTAGLPAQRRLTVVRITLSRLREWTVTGRGPWDNTYAERTFT